MAPPPFGLVVRFEPERFAVEREAAAFPEGAVRVEAPPELAAAERFAAGRLGVERFAAERFAAGLAAAVDRLAVDRFAVERLAVERLAGARAPAADAPPSSSVQLPDSTRCAASATASAISEPRRVALETAAVAACDALSAASRPASRIARRAFGLAAIAAAAAVSPAASISRLIAAFASLSTVDWPELERDEDEEDELREPDFLLDLAIANLPCAPALKTHELNKGSVSCPNGASGIRRSAPAECFSLTLGGARLNDIA